MGGLRTAGILRAGKVPWRPSEVVPGAMPARPDGSRGLVPRSWVAESVRPAIAPPCNTSLLPLQRYVAVMRRSSL